MKISFLGPPGYYSIPPVGHGAVEIVIYEYAEYFHSIGWDVQVVNRRGELADYAEEINEFEPNFVHIHWDQFYEITPLLKCRHIGYTSHHANAGRRSDTGEFVYKTDKTRFNGYALCLSEHIREAYVRLGLPADRCFVLPNGANSQRFSYTTDPSRPDASICLAQITDRKNQAYVQNLGVSVYFAGGFEPSAAGFNVNDPSYLGSWAKERVYRELTQYASFVLLSFAEAAPCATVEALMAGLGLVVSEWSTANLDLSLPFIDVVPSCRWSDPDYVRQVIQKNRATALRYRHEIRDYALRTFDWKILCERYRKLIVNKLLAAQ